jgi:hypothetical protein
MRESLEISHWRSCDKAIKEKTSSFPSVATTAEKAERSLPRDAQGYYENKIIKTLPKMTAAQSKKLANAFN